MKRFFLITCLYILLSCTFCIAQQLPVNLHFNKFTTENGLSDNHIGLILKDKNGYLWISTQNGINRFDGVEFKNFHHDPKEKNSLLSNLTSALAEDSLGRIWIDAVSGVSMYNPATGKFWNFIPSEKEFVKTKVVWLLTAHDGSVWFSTWNKLNNIDLKSLQVKSYLIDTAAPDKNNVSAGIFFEDHNGDFWFDSYKGIYIFHRNNHTISRFSKSSGLSGMYDDGKGKIYFAGWGGGLKEYDIATKKTTEYFFHNLKFSPADSVRAITWITHSNQPQLKNFLWVSTEVELAVFDIEKKKFVRFFQFDPIRQNVSPGSWFGETLFDENNNFWLCSREGLYTASLEQFAITNYYLPNPKASGGGITRIREDIHDPATLWVSVDGSGIFKIDSRTGNILSNFLPDKTTRYTDSNRNFVLDFLQLKNGALWLGGGCSLTYFNPLTGESYFIRTPQISRFSGHLSGTYSLLPKSDSDCWVSTDAGIGTFSFTSHSFQFYPHYNISATQNSDEHYVRLLMKDNAGNIWFYNHNDGFFMYDPISSKFTTVAVPEMELRDLISRSIIQSPDSTVWLGANDQLFYKKKDDSLFRNTRLSSINGLLIDVATDKKNNLYVLTLSGIVRYEKQTGKQTEFTTKDGLISSAPSGLDISDDGKIFLKDISHFSEINTGSFRKDYAAAPLIFESMSINGRDTSINFNACRRDFLRLSYKQDQITIHFRLMNFRDPAQTNYYYKLDGWDKDWVLSGTGNYAAYSNLPGGDYTFHVKAVNLDGTVNPQQAVMLIRVSPPFWKTWWFYSLVVLAIISLLYFIYTLRMQRLLAVEKLRSKISRDLHDDVGSTLTSINIWSDVAERQLQTDAQKSVEYIGRIKKTSQNMLDNMNDIIWAINPVNDTLEKVLIRMKIYASEILEPKNISFLFSVDNEIKSTIIPMQYRREWYLIFKEAINNAAKYSCAKNIEVSIMLNHHNLVMHIKDDGKGFLFDGNGKGNGLRNMKQRAEQMKGSLQISSAPGKGTVIVVEVHSI